MKQSSSMSTGKMKTIDSSCDVRMSFNIDRVGQNRYRRQR